MTRERSDLGFGDALSDIDLSGFAPKPARKPRPAKEIAQKAAAAAGFKSREPKPETPAARPEAANPPRRRRTGRNAQLNLKARPETIEAYCALADRMGWGLGETLEQAVALLEERFGR